MSEDIDPILRMPAVKKATGLSRATIYRYVKLRLLPAPKRVGINAVGWHKSWIDQYLASRPITTVDA